MVRYHLVEIKKQYKLGIAFDYDHTIVQIMRDLKGVFGGKYNWDFKIWVFPFTVIPTFESRIDNPEKIEIDDDVLEYVEKERNKATATAVMSRSASSNIFVPCPEGYKYRPFQLAGVEFMVNYLGVLQADVMGLGKTIQSIGTINYLTDIRKILIVAPKTLTYTWKTELETWLTRDLSVGLGDHKNFPDTDIRITHYEVLRRMVDLQFHWKEQIGTKKKKRGRAKKILDWGTLGCQYDLIICDEAHKIKNPKAQQSIIIYQLAKFIKRRWYLTGSPFGSYIIDLWPLIHSLNPKYWDNWHQFTTRYCWDGFENKGAKNIPELKERLRASVMIRRTNEQVLKELPAKIYQLIEIPEDGFKTLLKKEQQYMNTNDFFKNNRKEYDLLRNRMLKLSAGDSEGWETLSNKVDRLCDTFRGFVGPLASVRKEIAIKKAPIVIEIIKDVVEDDPKRKVGIYCHHKDVVDEFTQHYFGKCVKIDGRVTKAEDRRKAVELFQTNPSITRFVGSIRAAGEGITLTASSHVVMAEIDFVPSANEQAIDRFHRIGQKDSVLVQIPVVKGSIEALIAKRNVEKQKIADMLLN